MVEPFFFGSSGLLSGVTMFWMVRFFVPVVASPVRACVRNISSVLPSVEPVIALSRLP